MDDDWEELFSEKHNRRYWKNKKTSEKTWKDPKSQNLPTVAAENSSNADNLKLDISGSVPAGTDNEEWEMLYNEKHKRNYWKNKKSGEKSWNPPPQKAVEHVAQDSTSDWVEDFNEKHKRKYWKNIKTGEKSWNPPPNLGTADAKPVDTVSDSHEATSDDWIEGYSEKHKRKYWKNKTTGKSQWTNPNGTTPGTLSKTGSFTSLSLAQESHTPATEWEELYSEKHKRKYWKNKATGKMSWTKPTEATATADEQSTVAAPIAPVSEAKQSAAEGNESEWTELYSQQNKRKYWKNKATGKTQWTPPPPSAVAKPQEHINHQPAPPPPVVEKKKSLVFRSVVRLPTNPAGLYFIELLGPIDSTSLTLYEIINENHFLSNCESFVLSEASITSMESVTEFRRLDLSSSSSLFSNVICNKEIGSLELILQSSSVSSSSSHHSKQPLSIITDHSTEESKSSSSSSSSSSSTEGGEESIILYFHSAVLAQQLSHLLFMCPSVSASQSEHEDHTSEHRLLMNSFASDLFVSASYLVNIPQQYLELEMILAKHNRSFYEKVFLSDDHNKGKEEEKQGEGNILSDKENNMLVPSIRYINPNLSSSTGEKSLETVESDFFPLSGMIVLKVQLNISSLLPDGSNTGNSSATPQLKSGAWMPCWITIDYSNKSISFYERGPKQPPSFRINCFSSTLRVNDLTDIEEELTIGIIDGVLSDLSSSSSSSSDLLNILFLFRNVEDLWRWSMSFSSICSIIQWKNNDFLTSHKLPKYHTFSSSPSDNLLLQSILNDGNVLSGLENAIIDRDIIRNGIRHISLPGYQLLSHYRFYSSSSTSSSSAATAAVGGQAQGRIIIIGNKIDQHHQHHSSCNRINDGSLLLSINGLSAVQLPSNTVLKFISDLPKDILIDIAYLKFPAKSDFFINLLEIDNHGIVPVFPSHHHHQQQSPHSSPFQRSSSYDHHDQQQQQQQQQQLSPNVRTTNTAVPTGIAGRKLDSEAANSLNRVLERKKSWQQSSNALSINEKLATSDYKEVALSSPYGSSSHLPLSPHQQQEQEQLVQVSSSLKRKKVSLNEFNLTNFSDLSWSRYRLTLSAGRLTFSSLSSENETEIPYSILLNACQLKVMIHHNKGNNIPLMNNLSELCLEISDYRYHLLLNCSSFRLFRSLLRSLLLVMKLSGSLPIDLPYVYSQGEKSKVIRSRFLKLEQGGRGGKQDVVSGRKKIDQAREEEDHLENNENDLHLESLKKTYQKYSGSGLLQQAMLLSNLSLGENDDEEEDDDDSSLEEGNRQHHHEGRKNKGKGSVIASIRSSIIDDYQNEEYRSRSLLQAAENLEDILSSLELPLVFPTPNVIDSHLQELRNMNRTNHQLIAELMTLQVSFLPFFGFLVVFLIFLLFF
jgi:hypothetical protein